MNNISRNEPSFNTHTLILYYSLSQFDPQTMSLAQLNRRNQNTNEQHCGAYAQENLQEHNVYLLKMKEEPNIFFSVAHGLV